MRRGYTAAGQKARLDPISLYLRMTREDIGNYPGLTLETISRLISRFQKEGLICVQQREVELRDAAALAEIAGQW